MLLFNKPTAISYISKSGDKIYPVVIDIKEGVKSSETLSFMTADSNTGILSVAFMEGETIYNIDDATVVCDIERPDGTDLSIGAVKVADGVVEVPLGVNGTSQPGMYMFDFKIVRPGSKTIGVPLVSYTVTQSINTDEIVAQDDRLPVLNDLIVKIQNATSASTQATNECKTATNNVNNTLKSVNNAIASGTVDLELKQLRTSLNGTLHPTANDRINQMETHLLEATATTIETESSFTTVDATSIGYFEDVKLEGKTLVNLSDLSSEDIVLTRTPSSGRITPRLAVGASDKLYLSFNCKSIQNITHSLGIIYSIEYVDSTPTDYLTVSNGSTIGHKVVKITPKSGVKNITITIHSSNIDDATATISDVMLMSLKDIDEHNPPSYFEGLMSVGQDAEEVSIESRNANLYNVDSMVDGKYIDITTGDVVPHASRSCLLEYIPITKNTLYFNQHESIEQLVVHCYDINKTRLQYVMTGKVTAKTLVLPEGTAFIRLAYAKLKAECKENGIYLGSIDIKYKPYQSNKKPLLYYNPTTETWEKPVLREWDTIEKHSDGKYYYHKRSGEVVLNGSETWNKASNFNYFWTTSIVGNRINSELINDRLPVIANGWSGEIDCISPHTTNPYIYINKRDIGTVSEFKAWLKANPTTVVYQLAQEEIYECTNIDLMTYSGETNYIINSGAISPKSLLKVYNNIANVVKILQEKVSLLENTFIAGLKSVLSGDMYSLATILYPEDFEQNDNTEQDIMVIPE